MELLPKSEAASRVRAIQVYMQQSSLDAVFILQNADLFYFSGSVQTGLFCIPACGDPLYLIQKSIQRARIESPWECLLPLSSLRKVPDLLDGEGMGRLKQIGLELDVLPANYFLSFRELFPDARVKDASDGIRRIRAKKSPYEVEQMRRAAAMLARVFQELPNWIRAGVTELELMAQVEGYLRLQGHQSMTRVRAFNGEMTYGPISSGPAATYPTRFPGCVGYLGLYPAIPSSGTRRVLSAGEPVLADLAGGYGGYIADKTRTFAVGDLAREFYDAHDFVLGILREIESMLKPAASCASIYRRALERAKDSPYASGFMGTGDNHVRFIGHGLGLELDELPVLSSGSDATLEAGMVIAVEPKVFFSGRGGVGIENNYLITESGFENLTRFPEEIVCCHV